MKTLTELKLKQLSELIDIFKEARTHENDLDKVFQAVNVLPDYMSNQITLPRRNQDNIYEKMEDISKCITDITGVKLEVLVDNY